MKKSGITIVFVIVCIGVLVAAYGIGVCIREIRFSRARAGTLVTSDTEKPGIKSSAPIITKKSESSDPDREPEIPADPNSQRPEDRSPRQRMDDPGRATGMFTKEQFENMSAEERREAFAQMRERSGNRRREGGSQLSEEDRAKMREEMESLRERWQEMSDEEKEKVEAEFTEKYGFFPNPDRRRSGGGPGGARGGRRRGGSDNGQS